MFVAFLELGCGKLLVFLRIQRLQVHQRYALIEWAGRRCEHFCHQMAVRTREDEVGIGASLDVGTEQCFYAIVGIVGDLLKLVDSNKAWFIGLVEISEYLIKRNFRIYHVADAYSPNWSPVDIERDF